MDPQTTGRYRALLRLLLVDGDPQSAVALAALLGGEGFEVRVAATAGDALRTFDEHGAELVLLDAGPGLCRALRTRSAVGIIVLSGCGGEDDKVAALEHGADDYVTRPYGQRELVARIRAVLRRTPGRGARPAVISAGPVRLDPAAHTATVTGRPLDLPLKEFQLLETLVRNPGRTLGRDQLLETVWAGAAGESNTLNVHIKRLRAKIEPDPAAPRHLLTVRGIGFKYLP
ncbi:response regulator transcription factor [Dactylosporangium matsuzakiense]|uniref:Sensory transduction protein RegX3 n=1 Tax=Dactylosporangium matsuzakiense TaxID=53360 RepID=A0A9W6KVB3_9ACTN|nr:DNA-binding response regulator [Dactylosporangium matsuzakiense]